MREYFYHRLSRVRILGKPGTPEFQASYELACDGHRSKTGRRTIAGLRRRLALGEVPPTNVYFVRSAETGLIKIGCAADVGKRLAKLQTGSSQPLELLRTVPDTSGFFLEGIYHKRWAAHRVRGEWFLPVPDLVEFATHT